jgi:hypothetical protein
MKGFPMSSSRIVTDVANILTELRGNRMILLILCPNKLLLNAFAENPASLRTSLESA